MPKTLLTRLTPSPYATLATVSAFTLIAFSYSLGHRSSSSTQTASPPVETNSVQATSPAHSCPSCARAAVPSRSLHSQGLLWENNNSPLVSQRSSLEVESGIELARQSQAKDKLHLTLEDGTELNYEVESRYTHTDGTISIFSTVPGQPEGKLHMQWNDKDGFFLGQIEYFNHPVAYEITRGQQGEHTITRKSIEQILCSEVEANQQSVRYGLPAVDEALASAFEEASGSEESTAEAATQEAQGLTPILNSHPSAAAVIYLDFDGEVVRGTSWGSRITADATGYSASKVTDIWKRVAADMQAFDINVTTEEAVYLNADATQRIRCIITPTNEWYGSSTAGGVAKLSSFPWSGDTPCWVFSDNLLNGTKYIAEACSHEVGHTLGLSHDGKTGTSYYAGHGSGAVGWAPIMGSGYYKSLTQWSKGEYSSATNTQDDLAIITSSRNGFGYRADDHGNSNAAATIGSLNSNGQIAHTGVIERRGDVDIFEFDSGAGNISLSIAPSGTISNLDIEAKLYNVQGQLLANNNPGTLLNATISTTVAQGTYYLHVQATGYGTANTGCTDYASLGEYQISGQLAAPITETPYQLSVAGLNEHEREPNLDPDRDGLSNLAEHALGTDPHNSNSSQNFMFIDPHGPTGADFIIDLPAEIPEDTLYAIEACCDLGNESWTIIARRDSQGNWSGPSTVVEETGPDGKRRFRITDESGETWTCRFMRASFDLVTS